MHATCKCIFYCYSRLQVVAPWVPGIMVRLVDIIGQRTTDPKLVENASITVGRLGLACPETLAPDLER